MSKHFVERLQVQADEARSKAEEVAREAQEWVAWCDRAWKLRKASTTRQTSYDAKQAYYHAEERAGELLEEADKTRDTADELQKLADEALGLENSRKSKRN